MLCHLGGDYYWEGTTTQGIGPLGSPLPKRPKHPTDLNAVTVYSKKGCEIPTFFWWGEVYLAD